MPAHLDIVGRVGELGEVALPVGQAALILPGLGEGDAAVATLRAPRGVEADQAIAHLPRLLPVLGPPVDALEIGEHAREELSIAHRGEGRLGEADALAQRLGHELAAGLGGEDGAAVEGIEENGRVVEPHAGDEVPGESDALHRKVEPAPYLDQDQGQRDRDAHAAVEHVREEAVAGVEVVGAVALEALLFEQVLAEPVEALHRAGRAPGALDGVGELVKVPEIPRGVQLRVLDAAQRDGGAGEADVPVGAVDLRRPRLERRVSGHQQPGAWWMPAVRSAAAWSSSASSRVRAAARRAAACASGVVARRRRMDRPSSWWKRSSGSITSW